MVFSFYEKKYRFFYYIFIFNSGTFPKLRLSKEAVMNLYDGLGFILEDQKPLGSKKVLPSSKNQEFLQVITGWIRKFFG